MKSEACRKQFLAAKTALCLIKLRGHSSDEWFENYEFSLKHSLLSRTSSLHLSPLILPFINLQLFFGTLCHTRSFAVGKPVT